MLELDPPDRVEDQLAWLRAVGFADDESNVRVDLAVFVATLIVP